MLIRLFYWRNELTVGFCAIMFLSLAVLHHRPKDDGKTTASQRRFAGCDLQQYTERPVFNIFLSALFDLQNDSIDLTEI